MNIFEYASRNALRFPSLKGDLTSEQLWAVPLTSNNGFNLDEIAKAANQALKDEGGESFVTPVVSYRKEGLEVKLEVVKFIIAYKIEEREKLVRAADAAKERQSLLGILAGKQEAKLAALTEEEIKAKLASLG